MSRLPKRFISNVRIDTFSFQYAKDKNEETKWYIFSHKSPHTTKDKSKWSREGFEFHFDKLKDFNAKSKNNWDHK